MEIILKCLASYFILFLSASSIPSIIFCVNSLPSVMENRHVAFNVEASDNHCLSKQNVCPLNNLNQLVQT